MYIAPNPYIEATPHVHSTKSLYLEATPHVHSTKPLLEATPRVRSPKPLYRVLRSISDILTGPA